jgi:mRNA-degrading endonuclease toxin of MazEF toxin-antitoxin module
VKLERWDIVFVPVHDKDSSGHPAVVLSPPDILEDNKQLRLNVLMGSKRIPAEAAKTHQVVLNGADGLEFPTLVDCSLVYQIRKTSILRHVGRVAHARRSSIAARVRAALGVG